MSTQIAVRLADPQLAAVDAAVKKGLFTSRADAVRAGLDLALRAAREQALEEAYRRGYGEHPQEDWVGEWGLGAMEETLGAEEENGPDARESR